LVSLRRIIIEIVADNKTKVLELIETITDDCLVCKVVSFDISIGKEQELPK